MKEIIIVCRIPKVSLVSIVLRAESWFSRISAIQFYTANKKYRSYHVRDVFKIHLSALDTKYTIINIIYLIKNNIYLIQIQYRQKVKRIFPFITLHIYSCNYADIYSLNSKKKNNQKISLNQSNNSLIV